LQIGAHSARVSRRGAGTLDSGARAALLLNVLLVAPGTPIGTPRFIASGSSRTRLIFSISGQVVITDLPGRRFDNQPRLLRGDRASPAAKPASASNTGNAGAIPGPCKASAPHVWRHKNLEPLDLVSTGRKNFRFRSASRSLRVNAATRPRIRAVPAQFLTRGVGTVFAELDCSGCLTSTSFRSVA
jgi:hypothetical protein